MKFGVVFPQTEIGADPGPVREFILEAEKLGFYGVMIFDHVIGGVRDRYPEVDFTYDIDDAFHEIMVLMGYMAAITSRIKLVTGIVILPQRQTVLVAKQAAEVDLLSRGRLVLGIGAGWNPIEFDALGESFRNRGRRSEEQINLMRKLWTQKIVDYQGQWNKVRFAGLNPLPVQRPIPVWFGGHSDPVLERTGRIGDGWIPTAASGSEGSRWAADPGLPDLPAIMPPDSEAKLKVEAIHDSARNAGRNAADIEIAVLSSPYDTDVKDEIEAWRSVGATQYYLTTMGIGLDSVEGHLETIRSFRKLVDQLAD